MIKLKENFYVDKLDMEGIFKYYFRFCGHWMVENNAEFINETICINFKIPKTKVMVDENGEYIEYEKGLSIYNDNWIKTHTKEIDDVDKFENINKLAYEELYKEFLKKRNKTIQTIE